MAKTYLKRDTEANPQQALAELNATDVLYDNSTSGRAASEVQGAIDESARTPIIAEADPGAIGAGNIWVRIVQTAGFEGSPAPGGAIAVRIRNATDNGWLVPTQVVFDANDIARAFVRPSATPTGGYEIQTYDADGAFRNMIAVTDAGMELKHAAAATAEGSWDAQVIIGADTESTVVVRGGDGNGTDYSQVLADPTGVQFGGFGTGARVGFAGSTPVRPELPATPTEQDIADVLVALGLVTQAA